eukprot:scaffold1155_cov92-Amphora_coffeaeformis.AAC.1
MKHRVVRRLRSPRDWARIHLLEIVLCKEESRQQKNDANEEKMWCLFAMMPFVVIDLIVSFCNCGYWQDLDEKKDPTDKLTLPIPPPTVVQPSAGDVLDFRQREKRMLATQSCGRRASFVCQK